MITTSNFSKNDYLNNVNHFQPISAVQRILRELFMNFKRTFPKIISEGNFLRKLSQQNEEYTLLGDHVKTIYFIIKIFILNPDDNLKKKSCTS